MSREDEILREACARAAREETEELKSSLTLEESRLAEETYRHHRPAALELIRRQTKPRRRWGRALTAAACVAVLLGAAYGALHRVPPEQTPAAQPPTPPVAPYHSPVPTQAPEITALPTAALTQTPSPTETPAPSPTPSPTPAPTEAPAPTSTPAPAAYQPQRWMGAFFPQGLPEGSDLAYLNQDNGCHAAGYTLNGKEIVFTEYDALQSLVPVSGAEIRYVALDNGLIALRTEEDGVVTLVWDQDGRTLKVECEEADAEEIANSVVKVEK